MQAAVAKPSPLIRQLPQPSPKGVVVRASGSIAGRAPVPGYHRPASSGGLISPAMPELMLALASYTTSWGTTLGPITTEAAMNGATMVAVRRNGGSPVLWWTLGVIRRAGSRDSQIV